MAIEQRNDLPADMPADDLMAATFPALLDDRADHAMAALLGALDLQSGSFDTARLDEPTQVLAHELSDRGWQAMDEYVHSFNGVGLRTVNLTMAGYCPSGAIRCAGLQTVFMPAIAAATLTGLLSQAPSPISLVFDEIAQGGTIAVPPNFNVYTLEPDPPAATVVITDAHGHAIGHHPVQTYPGAGGGAG